MGVVSRGGLYVREDKSGKEGKGRVRYHCRREQQLKYDLQSEFSKNGILLHASSNVVEIWTAESVVLSLP